MSTTKRSRPRITDKRLALHKRVTQIGAEITKLKRDRAEVNRDEFREMSNSLRQLQKNSDDLAEHTQHLAIQLMRIAQLQAEVDAIKRALVKAKMMV